MLPSMATNSLSLQKSQFKPLEVGINPVNHGFDLFPVVPVIVCQRDKVFLWRFRARFGADIGVLPQNGFDAAPKLHDSVIEKIQCFPQLDRLGRYL